MIRHDRIAPAISGRLMFFGIPSRVFWGFSQTF
jgi:hypothetical protein